MNMTIKILHLFNCFVINIYRWLNLKYEANSELKLKPMVEFTDPLLEH